MQMLSLGMRRCVTLEDGDCYIIGIANGFQMKQESMRCTKRGKTIRKPLRPRIGYIHCGMMSDDGG